MARDEAAEEAEQEAEEEEEEEEDLVVVGADGIEITAASEEEDDEDEDYTSRCPEGYFDHDKDHRSRAYRTVLHPRQLCSTRLRHWTQRALPPPH